MDFDFSDEENNNNENEMSPSEYLANELKEHKPRNKQRFSLVQSTMGDRGYYILVNIFANEVQSDGVKTFYVFEGIKVYDEEVEGNRIKEESMVTVLNRLKDNVQPLFYYEQEEFGDQPHRITEIDIISIGPPIISGTTWMSRFDENDKTVVEDKINTKIELLQNKEEKTPAPSSPKRQSKKLYESDLKF
jgi:hypothetical protein